MRSHTLTVNGTHISLTIDETPAPPPCADITAVCSPDIVESPQEPSPRPAIYQAVIAWAEGAVPPACDQYWVRIQYTDAPSGSGALEDLTFYRRQTVRVDGKSISFTCRYQRRDQHHTLEFHIATLLDDDRMGISRLADALMDWFQPSIHSLTGHWSAAILYKDRQQQEKFHGRYSSYQFTIDGKRFYFTSTGNVAQTDLVEYVLLTPVPERSARWEREALRALKHSTSHRYTVAALPGVYYQLELFTENGTSWKTDVWKEKRL